MLKRIAKSTISALILANLFGSFSAPAGADEFVTENHKNFGISLGGWFGSKKTADVTTPKGFKVNIYGQNGVVQVQEGGWIAISGPPAQAMGIPSPTAAAHSGVTASSAPELPKSIPLITTRAGKLGRRGSLIGAWIEMSPGSGIYVTARHVLQDLADVQAEPLELLENSFRSAGLSLKDYTLLSARENDSPIDAVIAVPGRRKKALAAILKSSQQDFNFKLEFDSPQYGLQGARVSFQHSTGQGIEAFDDTYFYLRRIRRNYSSPGSSGAPVYLRGQGQTWRLGGILQCVTVPQSKSIEPTIRVLRISALAQTQLSPLDPNDWVREPMNPLLLRDRCKPFGLRGGGGL